MSMSSDRGMGADEAALMTCLRSMLPSFPRRVALRPACNRWGSREEAFQETLQRTVEHRLGQELCALLIAPTIRDDRPAPELVEMTPAGYEPVSTHAGLSGPE